MFAIQISERTHEKIILEMGKEKFDQLRIEFFTNRPYPWYVVSQYCNNWGQPLGWVILPASVIQKHFEYNPDVIVTDWDQIVRKEEDK